MDNKELIYNIKNLKRSLKDRREQIEQRIESHFSSERHFNNITEKDITEYGYINLLLTILDFYISFLREE